MQHRTAISCTRPKLTEPVPKLSDPDVRKLCHMFNHGLKKSSEPQPVKGKSAHLNKVENLINRLDTYIDESPNIKEDTIHKQLVG